MSTKARLTVIILGIVLVVAIAIKTAECRFGRPLSGEGLIDAVEVAPWTSPRSIRVRGHIHDAISVIKDITPTIDADGNMLIRLRYSYAGFPCATASRDFDVSFPMPATVREVRFGEAKIILWQRDPESKQ